MRRQTGFTFVELLVVIAILGILAASAMPTYRTWLQRAYGSEAVFMARRIMDGQIAYFLEHNQFFPESGPNPIDIYLNTPANDPKILDINKALNILIPAGHKLEYHLQSYNVAENESFTLVISANFPLFKGQGTPSDLIATINKNGTVEMIGP